MHYEEFVPSGPAAAFVERVWRLEHADGRDVPPQEVLPDGCMEIVLHLADAFEQLDDDRWTTQDRLLVAGQITGPLRLRATGSMHVVGIRFRPGGARRLLSVPQHELTGRILPLASVAPALARRLMDGVDTRRPEGIASGIADALGSAPSGEPDRRVSEAVGLIRRTHGRISVDALAAHCNLSGRQLERRFLDDVGLPPKRLARIVRFQRALRILTERGGEGGAALAADLGYADQPHFIRDFREFAGRTPGEHPGLESALTALFTAR